MFTGQVDVISRHATWQSKIVEVIDVDDETQVDLSDSELTVAVEVTIRDYNDCTLVTGTLDDGKVELTSPAPAGIFWQFEVDDLQVLCAATYRLVILVTINDVVTCLVDGTLAVTD
jgi:hypothetical protein